MIKDSDYKLEPEHAPGAENFFAEDEPIHETEMHPQTVIRLLKQELRRSQAHIQNLYRRITELTQGEK